nr:MAG TPA: crystallin beta/gamma motif-containing protein [Caudoviricetes sp.]
MNEQEQTAKTPFTTPAPFAALEPERRSIYLPEEQLIVNTTLQRAEEVNYALQTEIYKKAKDNFFAFKRLDESIPDTTYRLWKTPLRAVADSGVSMWQAGERLMAGGIGAILDEYEYMKQDSAARKKYRELYQQLNEQAPDVESRKEALSAQAEQEFNQIRQDYEHNRKLGRDALLVMSQNHAKFRELAGIAKNEKDGFLYDLFGAGGSLVFAIGLTVLTGSPAAAAIAFGATAGQQDYEEALKNGVSPTRALLAGVGGGIAEGGIELLGMEMLFKSLTKTGVLGRIAASALSEGSEEAAQQTAEEIIMQNFGGRQQEFDETLYGIGYSFVVGSLTAVPVATLVNRASKKLQDKGIKKETADKMALNMAKETATPENNASVHQILSNATSPLVYPHGDVEQGAQAFKESIDKARNPDRETTRKMYEVAERTEQKALAAGYDTTSAALLGNLEQSRANSVLNVAGLKPGEFEMTEVDFENAPVQDNTQAVQAGVAAQREKWAKEYEEYQARKAQAKAAADTEFDRKLKEAGLPEGFDYTLGQEAYGAQGKANTNSPAFKEWFGNSNAVDENGKPLMVYHGTHKKFDTFDTDKIGTGTGGAILGKGFYFTNKKGTAEQYAYGFFGSGKGKGDNNVMPVFLSIQNPAKNRKEYNPSIHDGVIEKQKDGSTFYLVSAPTQIKSVYNRGTFDSANPNIYLQENIENVRPSTADMFAPDGQTAERFKENVKTVLSDENISNKQQVEMGQLPPLYTELGLPQQELKTNKLALRKALGLLTQQELAEHKDWHNHNVPQETIDNLPALLSDPVAVLRSNTKNGSFVAVLDSEVQGKPVVAIVSPNLRKGGYTFIPSVYERNNYETFLKTTAEKGNVLYWDKNRMSLPGALTRAAIIGNDILIDNITTKEDVVKAQESGKTNNPSELLQENLFNIRQNPEEITEIHNQKTGEVIPLEMNPNLKPFKPVELKSDVLPMAQNTADGKKQLIDSVFGKKEQLTIEKDGKTFLLSRSSVKKMQNTGITAAKDYAKEHNLKIEERRQLYHDVGEQVAQALNVFETAQLILSHKDVKNVPGRTILRYGNIFNYRGKTYYAMFVSKQDGVLSDLHLYDLQTEENKYTAGNSGVINNPSQQRYTNSIGDLVRFVKRKIAKYNNNVSGKGSGSSELLQENLFNIQQNLFDKQQSLFDTQVNAEERTAPTQEDSELKEAADGLFSEEELKQDLPPFTPTGKPERIEDFGEKILGARKDMWGKYRAAMTSELPADVRSITLSQYFPEPNYEAAIAKGITTEQLAIVKALRDSIPAKPQRLGRAAQWVEGLKAARETANQVLQHPEMVNLFKKTDKTDTIHNRVAFYLELGYPAFTKAKEYSLRPGNFLMFNGQRFNEPQKIYLLERGYKRVAGSQNRAEMVALARKMLAQSAAPAKAPTKLDVYQRRDTGEIIIGKKIATGKFIDLKGGFERVKDAFDFLTKNQAHLEALLAEKRKIYPVRRDTNAPRVGKEYRPAGTVITPERFSQEFGFRGVQFGNWVEQERRAQDLNNAYDALLDMADIIRIPARAVSLDGTLGLAFGARGKANELAHYERDHVVINLNKKNGAGSLGHEWWHALDNYFSRQDGQNEMTSENPKANSALRPEMKEAYQGVLKAITDTFYSRSVNLDKLRSKPYWSTRTEMTARAFESYLVYKAKQEGHSNDYLANIVNPEAYLGGKERFPYPTDTEMPAIAAAFDRFFNTLKTAETPRGYTLYAESEGDTSFDFGQNVAQPDFLGKVVFAQDSNRAIIVASTSANESTAIHEYFHIWERDLYRAEKVSTEPEFLQMMQDLRQIHADSAPFVMEYLGKTKLLNDTARASVLQTIQARGGDEYIKRLAFNDSLDENDTTAQFVRRGFRENFATKAEKYFHNGKAPNAAYKSLFEKFAAWLRDIYGALTGVDLSPEVQEFFDKLLAKEARRVDSKLFTGKVDKLKQQINNIRQGSPRGDFTLEQIKDLVSTLDAPAPKLPTNHLLKDLRRYGAEYANAGQIDKEAYKNARVFNKKGGIGDDPARWLADHGYLTEAEGRTYEEQDRINQQAYDLIDRALNGEVIYPIGTEKQIADFENYKSLMDTMREAWGDPREAKKTLKAILELEEKGYRVVEKRDLADFSLRLGELNRLAERLDNKSQTVQNKEQASAATLDAARKIKRHLITELNKRQIEGKDGLIKQLENAKTFEEIQTAAAGALDFLEDAYDRTNEGQEERRRTDLPNTNWDNVRAELLRAYSESIGHVDEKIQQAWRVLNMASSGQLKLYENLTDEEVARRRTAAEKVLKEAEPKLEAALMRAMESVLRKQGGLESDQVRRLVAKYARSASRQRSLWKHEIDELIKQTREIQEDNYKQYMNKKIQALLNMNLFDRRGNFRRAMTDPTTMSALEELRRVAHLGPQSAADELQNRMLVDKPNSLIDRIINEMLSIQAYARKDVTCQLFKQAYEDIHALRKAGREAKILEKMIKDFRTEQDKSEVLGAIKKNKQAGKLKQMYASWIANWESFLDMVTDKETKEKYSMLNLEADTITYTWQRRTEIMDGVKRIYGLGSNREVQNKMNALRNEKYTFTNYALVDKNTNAGAIKRTGEAFPEELNKLQIIDAYIYAKNDNLMDRLLNQYGGQLNDMFALLDKQDRALGDFLQKEAEKTYAQINSVFVKERGYDLPRVENYFPSKTERVESELDFLNAAAAMSKNPSFTKMRASSAFVQMKLENPFGILFTHIDRAADYTFKAEKLNQIIRVFKSPVLKPAIIEQVGEDCYKRMLELIDQFSVSKPRLNYEMDKLGDWLTNNYVKGAIALKPTIAVKQLISSINYAENMPASQWVSGFAKAIMHPKETVEFMMSGDPYLKARYESGSMNEALARATADANALTARGKFLRFTDLLTINTRLGDVGAIMFGGKPYVDYLMQTKGMSKKEAFAEFRKATLRSQQANTRSSLSTLQARDMNFIVRGLFAFKNTPAQYARKIADAIYEYQRGEISRAQLAKVVAIYGLFNSWMYSALTTLGILAWYYDDDDADEILADELFFSPFVQMAGCLPVLDMAVGTAAEVAKAKMFDHKVRMERPELPVVSDLFKMGQTAVKDDLAAEDVLNMLVESGQLIGGLPTKYAKGFYTGAGDIAGGENPMRGFLQMLGYTENRAQIATNTKK